jgi:hypothetical protein
VIGGPFVVPEVHKSSKFGIATVVTALLCSEGGVVLRAALRSVQTSPAIEESPTSKFPASVSLKTATAYEPPLWQTSCNLTFGLCPTA